MKKVLLLAAACLLAFGAPAVVSAGGNHGGGCHNDECGAKIEAKYCFDLNEDGWCSSAELVDGSSVYIYNSTWEIMSSHVVGRDDGIVGNAGDKGVTTFLGLQPGRYIVCASGYEDWFTYPVATTPDPSSRVSIVERLSIQEYESRYCFSIRLRDECSREKVYFAFFSDAE